MAKKKAAQVSSTKKKVEKSTVPKRKTTKAASRPRLCRVHPAPPTGRLVLEDGFYKAQDELRTQLGGYEAILARPRTTSRIKDQNNLMGLAIGMKRCAGQPTGELAIKVYVRKKVPNARIAADALIPTIIAGYPTDVEEIGVVRAHSSGGRTPKIPCGEPIANVNGVEEGTLGCLVVTDGRECLLTCNHVIANLNNAQVGEQIVYHDTATNTLSQIGALWKWVTLLLDDPSAVNEVDVAVAELNPLGCVIHKLIRIPLSLPPRDVSVGDMVQKYGAATGAVTHGVVDAINADVFVEFQGKMSGATVVRRGLFRKQILIRGTEPKFGDQGDSGSIVLLSGTNQPVGLYFAGDPVSGTYYANPIRSIVQALTLNAMAALTPF